MVERLPDSISTSTTTSSAAWTSSSSSKTTRASPTLAVTKAKKLVLQDKVHMLIGGLLASTGYALAPVSTAEKTLYIASVAGGRRPDAAAARQISVFHPRPVGRSSQPHHPLGQWACDQGYKKVVTIAADYAFGYEVVGGFQKAFEDCGGKVIQKIWPPLGTKDFGPYIPTIKADADADLLADGRPDGAAIPQAIARLRATRSRSSAAAPATTNSCCRSWATRSSATCRRCTTAPRSTRRKTRTS